MRLANSVGGGGIQDNAGTCAATWVGTVANNWAKVLKFAPCLSHVDIKSSQLPLFVEFRAEYARLRQSRTELAAFYRTLDGASSEYFDFDGTVHHKFHPSGLPPASRFPEDVSRFATLSCDSKPPALRELRTICCHAAWRCLMRDCVAADTANQAAGMTTLAREASRLVSTGLAYSGAWLQESPLSWRQRSSKVVIGLQRRYGLYISSAASLFDAVAAEGEAVTIADRLGDSLANAANHSDAHKWLVVNWKRLEAAAAPEAVVRQGDKGSGLVASPEYCNSYIGDVLIQNDDGREIVEIKNYTTFVTAKTGCAAVCTLNASTAASTPRAKPKSVCFKLGFKRCFNLMFAGARRLQAHRRHRLRGRVQGQLRRLPRQPQGAPPPRHLRGGPRRAQRLWRSPPAAQGPRGQGARRGPDGLLA